MKNPAGSEQLDLRPPRTWRRLVPAWLRSLIWVDSAASYDAFLSYSWKSDGTVAPVIQSVLQRFLCPWYRLRARTVFRDLSCLPASSSLETELFDRLDKSTHLIVLASPDAAHSRGMELEAQHWFSRERAGQVLIIATAGEFNTWEEIREHLLPITIRNKLTTEALWVPLQHRRAEILAKPNGHQLHEELIEDLKQIFLRLYPEHDWGRLRGEERSQRRRAIGLLLGLAFLFLILALAAIWFAAIAKSRQLIADSRRLAVTALLHRSDRVDLASLLGVQGFKIMDTFEARNALLRTNQSSPGLQAYLHHHSSVVGVTFSPDGKTLASASQDGSVQLWDTTTRQQLDGPMGSHKEAAVSVTFSPDGKTLASASLDQTVQLWDVGKRQPLGKPLRGHTGNVLSVAFSVDGKKVASASRDGTVRLWDVTSRRLVGSIRADRRDVNSVAFSPDGKMLAAAGSDAVIRFWDLTTWQPVGEPMRGHSHYVYSIAFSPDGKTLASGSQDKTVRLWDVATRHPLGEPVRGHHEAVESVAFSPDGKSLASASADKTLRVWDVATHQQVGEPLRYSSTVYSVAFSRDGKMLASASLDEAVRLWDVPDRHSAGELLPDNNNVYDAAFSADGKNLAWSSRDGTVQLWDVATRRQVGKPLYGDGDGVGGLALSPDGRMLASVSNPCCSEGWEPTVLLWDLAEYRSLGDPLRGHKNFVRNVAFSPDGKTIASASQDDTVRLWNVKTQRPLGKPLNSSGVDRVTFSPNGKTLASASGYGTVQLWDVASHRSLGEGMRAPRKYVNDLAFSPDGKTLVSVSNGETRLWDTATHQPVGEPLSDNSIVDSIAFSPDGKIIASGSGDGTVRLWDVLTHQPLGEPITGPGSPVITVKFSPDGKTLAWACRNKTMMLWDTSAEAWILRACRRANRNLSLTEWQQYVGNNMDYEKTCPELLPGEGVAGELSWFRSFHDFLKVGVR